MPAITRRRCGTPSATKRSWSASSEWVSALRSRACRRSPRPSENGLDRRSRRPVARADHSQLLNRRCSQRAPPLPESRATRRCMNRDRRRLGPRFAAPVVVRYGIAVVPLAALAVVGRRLRARATESAPTVSLVYDGSLDCRTAARESQRRSSRRDAGRRHDGRAHCDAGEGARSSRDRELLRYSRLQNRGMDVRHIADTLGVAYVVEGDLQKTGSRLRVQMRLRRWARRIDRWSDTYDREFRDVFAVEDDIGGAVVRELNVTPAIRLGSYPGAGSPCKNVAAYELYRHGNDRILIRTDSGRAHRDRAVPASHRAGFDLRRSLGRVGAHVPSGGPEDDPCRRS